MRAPRTALWHTKFVQESSTFPNLGVQLEGWSVAPESADISRLVVTGDASAGPLVHSTIGTTSVDLPAIEELFA